jgi:predicted phage tail protein
MILRSNILQTKIKIHSAYKNIFNEKEYSADLEKYADILFYLGSMHPKFKKYASAIYLGECQEGYAILDKDLKPVSDQDLFIKTIKPNDEFYVVPAIVGSGGKRTTKLLQYAALAAAVYVGGSALVGALSTGGGAVGASVAREGAIAASAMGGAGAAGTAAGGGFFGISASTLAINAGLALVTAMFTKRPELQGGGKDAAIRQNNMFGGLQNTIESGTPIPMIYGMHRMTGQLISGYLDTVDHGKDDEITVQSRFVS